MQGGSWLWACVVGLGACGGGGGGGPSTGSAEPSASTVRANDPPTTGVASSRSAIARGAAILQCERALEKAWQAMRPVLALVGVEPAAVEKSYRAGGSFVERCAALDAKQRACIEQADNPVVGIHACKVNAGKEPATALWAPSIWVDAEEPLAPGEGAKLLATLSGTWVSDWKSYGQTTTWKIDGAGHVDETKLRDGKSERAKLELSFEDARRVKVRTTPTSTQDYVFLKADDATFYASSNLAYDAYPVADEKRFTVALHRQWLVVDGEGCRVVSERGEIADGRCSWGRKEGSRIMTVDYQIANATRTDSQPRSAQLVLHRIGGFLLADSLVTIGRFTKK